MWKEEIKRIEVPALWESSVPPATLNGNNPVGGGPHPQGYKKGYKGFKSKSRTFEKKLSVRFLGANKWTTFNWEGRRVRLQQKNEPTGVIWKRGKRNGKEKEGRATNKGTCKRLNQKALHIEGVDGGKVRWLTWKERPQEQVRHEVDGSG